MPPVAKLDLDNRKVKNNKSHPDLRVYLNQALVFRG